MHVNENNTNTVKSEKKINSIYDSYVYCFFVASTLYLNKTEVWQQRLLEDAGDGKTKESTSRIISHGKI